MSWSALSNLLSTYKKSYVDGGRLARQASMRLAMRGGSGGTVDCRALALVAQRIEHLTTDQKVGGSSPSERATISAGQGPVPNLWRGCGRLLPGLPSHNFSQR